MSSNEEYLDNLLKSIVDGEDEGETEQAGTNEKPAEELFLPEQGTDGTVDEITVAEPTEEVIAIETPTMEEPLIEEPLIEEPLIEEPLIEEPLIEEPLIEEHLIEESLMEEPFVEEPFIEEPLIEESLTKEPSIGEIPPVEELFVDDYLTDDMAIIEPSVDELALEEPLLEDAIHEETGSEELFSEELISDSDIAIEESLLADMELEEEPESTDSVIQLPEPDTEEASMNDFAIEEPSYDEEEAVAADGNERAMSADEIDAIVEAADLASHDLEPETAKTAEGNDDDDELAEINGLLKHSEDEASSDDDMLALLESMAGEKTDNVSWHDDESEEVQQSNLPEEDSVEIPKEQEEEQKVGFFAKLFGKKNKKAKKNEEFEKAAEDETGILNSPASEDSHEEAGEQPEEIEDIRDVEEKEKKTTFFSKILAFLTEANDDDEKLDEAYGMEPSEENKNILEELDQEDKKKKKKKSKGKGKEKSADDLDEDEDGRSKGSKQTGKKEKKGNKKEKVKKEKIDEHVPFSKKVNKRNVSVVVALCVTLGAVVVMISSIIPTYFDKREARDSYSEADYAASYILLYGKKLDTSDELIFNKSRVIMEMKRKLDSYHNYISLDQELEALDALMSGVERYEQLAPEAEQYNVIGDVDAVYATILSILKDKYQLEESMAKEINSYSDDLAYTRRLKSIIFGTPYVDPAEEQAEKEAAAADSQEIIPAEEAAQTPMSPEAAPAENTQDDTTAQDDNAAQESTNQAETPAPEQQTPETPQGEAVPEGEVTPEEPQINQGQLIEGVRQPVEVIINGN